MLSQFLCQRPTVLGHRQNVLRRESPRDEGGGAREVDHTPKQWCSKAGVLFRLLEPLVLPRVHETRWSSEQCGPS